MSAPVTAPSRREKLLFGTLLVLMALPLPFTLLLAAMPKAPAWLAWLNHPWLRNEAVNAQAAPDPVPFSWQSVKNAHYQESVAGQFDRRFAGREILIRWTNEVYFRVFNESTLKGILAFGPHHWIIHDMYLQEYYLTRVEKRELEPLASGLKRLQDIWRSRGKGFVVVLTPSKTSVYPEEGPPGWAKRYDPRPRAYVQLLELFREKGVIFVDAAKLTKDKATQSKSLFPKGGIHWTQPAGLEAANAMIDVLRGEGMNFQRLKTDRTTKDVALNVSEGDVLAMANLALPWHYPYTDLHVHLAHPEGPVPSMVAVGGSFTHLLGQLITASRQVSSGLFFFYYKYARYEWLNGVPWMLSHPANDFDMEKDIFQKDCLIVELNEQQIPLLTNSVSQFVHEALDYADSQAKKGAADVTH